MSEIKPFSGVDDRISLAEAIPLPTPFTLNIFPTSRCNFKCSYCAHSIGAQRFKDAYDVKLEDMSLEMLKLLVKQAKAFSQPFKLVSFMGHGEPLLNRNFSEMVRLVKRSRIADRIDVITNGSLLTRELGMRLIDSGIDVIRISLQGISSESYKRESGVDFNFTDFIKNLTYVFNNRRETKIYVKTMNTSLKRGQDKEFFALFSEISDRMHIDEVKPVYDLVEYGTAACDLTRDRYGEIHEKRFVCPQPFYMLSVWPDGNVFPCDALYKACLLGNVRTASLRDMWKSQEIRRFRIEQLKKRRFLDKACQRCCAPDDVIHKEDVLDGKESEVLERLNVDY